MTAHEKIQRGYLVTTRESDDPDFYWVFYAPRSAQPLCCAGCLTTLITCSLIRLGCALFPISERAERYTTARCELRVARFTIASFAVCPARLLWDNRVAPPQVLSLCRRAIQHE